MNENQIKIMNQTEHAIVSRLGELQEKQGLTFPKGYNPTNALQGAMLMIKQDSKLHNCVPASIAQSLINMVTLGLDVTKKQCYLIPYGGNCTLSPSYFGSQTILRRIDGVIDVVATCVYEGDDFDFDIEDGIITNVTHKTSPFNRDNDVKGVYATITLEEDVFGRSQHVEFMTRKEIEAAWGQGATKGKSPAHKNFPQEMSKKTVINRACKNFTNTLTETTSDILVKTFNDVNAEEYERVKVDSEILEQDFVNEETKQIENDDFGFDIDEDVKEMLD